MTAPPPAAATALQLRPSSPEDQAFLRTLFSAGCTHLHALGLPQAAIALLIDQQYAMRAADYGRRFAQARILIAQMAGEPVGQITLHDNGQSLHIVDIAVAPAARQRGHGTALVRYAQVRARDLGRQAVNLSVDPSNQGALRLYQALGFQTVEAQPTRLSMAWRP